MRIYRNGEYFSEGDDLQFIADIANEPVSLYSFHPDDYREYMNKKIQERCDSELSALKAGYSYHEASSWDKQESEARAWSNDPLTPTPLLDAISTSREMDKSVLVTKVIAKADLFSVSAGNILGKRQKLQDQLDALTDWVAMSAISWDD